MLNIRKRIYLYGGLLALSLGTMYLLRQGKGDAKQDNIEKSTLPRDLEEIRQEGKLRLIAPYSFIPVDSLRDKGVQNLSFIRKLSNLSKLEVQLIFEDNVMKAIQLLLQGKADAVLSAVEKTSQLDSLPIDWITEDATKPIYLVQKQDTVHRVNKHSELNGKEITIPRHSPYKLFIRHLSDDLGINVKCKEDSLYNTEQLIMLVNAGKLSYTICDGEEVEYYKKHFPSLNYELPMSHALRRGWVVRRQSPVLKDSLLHWLH